jgi:hypothetical protein
VTAQARSRILVWRHPEWWVVPLVGLSWLLLIAASTWRPASPGVVDTGGYATLFVCPIVGPNPTAPLISNVLAGLGSGVMVVAMMGVSVLPALHHVGVTGLWSRRWRGPSLVLAGFVATWLPVVWVLDVGVWAVASAAGSLVAIGLAVTLGAAWQLTERKARAVRSCGRMIPIAARGWRADIACLRQGALIARSCEGACAGFMLVAAAAGHGVIAMATFAAIQWYERSSRRQRPLIGMAAALAVGAIAVGGSVAT